MPNSALICAIPIGVKGRAPVFACPGVAAAPTCDIVTVVGQVKHLAQGEAWRWGIEGAFWQTSFWATFFVAMSDSSRSSGTF